MTDPTASPDASSQGPSPEAAPSERGGAKDRTPRTAGFLRDFPDDPRLRELAKAFEAGNYARVRVEAPRLAAESDDEAVREAARDLRRRIEPDPLVKYLLLVAVLLLLGITAFAYGNH